MKPIRSSKVYAIEDVHYREISLYYIRNVSQNVSLNRTISRLYYDHMETNILIHHLVSFLASSVGETVLQLQIEVQKNYMYSWPM